MSDILALIKKQIISSYSISTVGQKNNSVIISINTADKPITMALDNVNSISIITYNSVSIVD